MKLLDRIFAKLFPTASGVKERSQEVSQELDRLGEEINELTKGRKMRPLEENQRG